MHSHQKYWSKIFIMAEKTGLKAEIKCIDTRSSAALRGLKQKRITKLSRTLFDQTGKAGNYCENKVINFFSTVNG